MSTYYFLVGIPGSGKSTYAKSLGCRIVCPDEIREAGIRDDAEVFEIARMMISHLLQTGVDVVFDATNTLRQYRAETIAAGKSYADHVVCIWIDTPLDVCIARHHARMRRGIRPTLRDEGIIRMAQQLADNPPDLSEGFDEIKRIGLL